jgi:hypothetical protein
MNDISSPTAPVDVPSPPLPATPEVTIPDQGPPSSGGEVGQQAPQKTHREQQWEKAAHRRASIERAFEKSRAAQAAKSDEGADKPKSEQPAQRQPPNRGEGGRFASAQPGSPDATREPGRPAAHQPSRYAPLADDAPYREAPPRFDQGAKNDWHGAPESVRAATTRAIQQYENGIRQYQQAANEFHQVRDYYDMAQKTGQNLRTVLDNYHGMEKRLRADPFAGVDLILHNLEIRKQDGSRYSIYDFAADVLRRTPDQHRMLQQQNTQQAQHHQMWQMHRTVENLATSMHQMQYAQRFTATRSEIDRFADSHPGFDERSDLIKTELEHGYPLHVAYERAMKLRPGNGATHAAQTRTASAQTREEIDRSISGAPNGSGQSSLNGRRKPSATNREALTNALRRVRSGA